MKSWTTTLPERTPLRLGQDLSLVHPIPPNGHHYGVIVGRALRPVEVGSLVLLGETPFGVTDDTGREGDLIGIVRRNLNPIPV